MPITLHLPDGSQVDVDPKQQIVLIGPNGVGKTRFAVDLMGRNNPRAERISANRFIGLSALEALFGASHSTLHLRNPETERFGQKISHHNERII